MKGFAEVYLLDLPYHADRPYTYYIPDTMQQTVVPGALVLVPFGRANRARTGVVFSVCASCAVGQTKPLTGVLSESFFLTEEQQALCLYLKEQVFCSVGAAARCMIPAGALAKLVNRYRADAESRAAVEMRFGEASGELALFSRIASAADGLSADRLRQVFPGLTESDEALKALVRERFVEKSTEMRGGNHIKYVTRVALTAPRADALAMADGDTDVQHRYGLRVRSAVYGAVLRALCASCDADIDSTELCAATGAGTAHLRMLCRAGIIELNRVGENRLHFACTKSGEESPLSAEQTACYEALAALYDSGEPRAALLHGVTGSGKTRVIKAIADRVIASGRQVIMLVPEIALTPQSIQIFCSYYGNRVAVIHSGLSEGERLDEWRRIAAGEADMVIGTRSAVFAPVPHLGLLVLDEEQEHTYKSDSDPKYHARDVARWRCARSAALMLLSSATPSLESYYKAKSGVYTLLQMKERYGSAVLPRVVMADMRQEERDGNTSFLSTPLLRELEKAKEAGDQSILFLNRRGYHHYVSCFSCGEAITCPHCSVTLTAHAVPRGRRMEYDEHGVPQDVILVCHYCGYRQRKPEACPHCGSPYLKYFGFGTQRTEDALTHLLPGARVLRMDTDTTRGRESHEKLLDSFRRGEADILLGTQMVTKGHDFPHVTLAGVLQADGMLAQNDYRAKERAFSLITQVIGRAGRADRPGLAVIQTYNPDNDTLKLAAAQDYETFYNGAIGVRRALGFPPFCDLALFSLLSGEEKELMTAARDLRAELDTATAPDGAFSDVPLEVFGPFEAQIYRVSERYRMRMLVKCRSNKRTRALLGGLLAGAGAKWGDRVSVSIDLNPSTL